MLCIPSGIALTSEPTSASLSIGTLRGYARPACGGSGRSGSPHPSAPLRGANRGSPGRSHRRWSGLHRFVVGEERTSFSEARAVLRELLLEPAAVHETATLGRTAPPSPSVGGPPARPQTDRPPPSIRGQRSLSVDRAGARKRSVDREAVAHYLPRRRKGCTVTAPVRTSARSGRLVSAVLLLMTAADRGDLRRHPTLDEEPPQAVGGLHVRLDRLRREVRSAKVPPERSRQRLDVTYTSGDLRVRPSHDGCEVSSWVCPSFG